MKMPISCQIKLSRKPIYIWIFTLITLVSAYLIYMAHFAPMGLDSPLFHQIRVYRSVNNILNAELLPKLGLTAWNDLDSVLQSESRRGHNIENLYLLNIAQYVHYSGLKTVFTSLALNDLARGLDIITLIVTSVLFGIVSTYLFASTRFTLLLSASACLIFTSSVWTYRAFLAPAKEFYMLPILLLGIIYFARMNIFAGLISLSLSSIVDYHWTAFIAASYLPSLASVCTPSVSLPAYIYPPVLRRYNILTRLMIPSTLLCGMLLAICQKFSLRMLLPGIVQSNSGIFYRIGIDSSDNIHYAGILGPFQFLFGQRVTSCLSNPYTEVSRNIFTFNCTLTLASNAFLAIASIVGVYILFRKVPNARWIVWPISIAFSCFSLIFSQSWSAHLSGYSYMFSPIFSVGIIYLVYWLLAKLFSPEVQPALVAILLPVMTFAVVVNSIRVSFLTGINA